MAYSKIIIDFTTFPDVDDVISFVENQHAITVTEVFKAMRLAANQVKLPPETSPGVFSGTVAGNFLSSFYYDYNTGSVFYAYIDTPPDSPGRGKITIEATYPNATFVLLSNTAGATITIQNETSDVFDILSVAFSEADTNKCQNVKVTVETSVLAETILQPFVNNANTDNPFSFDYLRGQTFNLRIRHVETDGFSTTTTTVNRSITTPDPLNAANFSLVINNSPAGATVIVNNSMSSGLELEYSLDGITWTDDNVFPSLAIDDYTLHVRDQFGCSFTQDFTINDNAIYTPVQYVSKTNAIIYAERVEFGDAINYRNDENSLSCEVEDKVKFQEIQLFQTADTVPTQFKSNYSTLVATVIKPDATTVNIPIVQKSMNIGQKDKRDAIKYDRGNGKTGIYFTAGNIYDYDTNAIIDTYSLIGYLPYWAQAGKYFSIGAAFYLIEEIAFDEVKNARVMVISNVYTGAPANIIVGSIFNYQEYEVYEYYIDMLPFLDMDIRVKLEMTDPNFPSATYLSEVIRVAVRHENTVEIRYKNTTNTDIYYATGIEFKVRYELFDKVGYLAGKSEINETDTNIVLLNADLYEGDEFIFELVTKQPYQKLSRAMSHEIVYMDGVGYVKDGDADLEKQQQSNAYLLTQKMLKNGNSYTSQSFGVGNALNDGVNVNIPGLVDYNNGFMQY